MNHEKEYDMLAEELMTAFRRFHRRDAGARAGGSAHKMSESRTLFILQKSNPEGMNVSDLSKSLRVTSPFVTQLVNRLEERGLIYRQKDPKDRRAVQIFLTEEGRNEAAKVQRNYREAFSGIVNHLGEEESKQLAKLLHKTFDYLENRNAEQSQGGNSD